MYNISGLTYYKDLLTIPDQLKLIKEIDSQTWGTSLSRRVQQYGYEYNYKNRSVDTFMYLGSLPAFLLLPAIMMCERGLIEHMPDQAIINEYLPGQGIAAHIDCEPCFEDTIASISLGWAYGMDFIPIKKSQSNMKTLLLEVGSALILRGEARYKWMHRIQRAKHDSGIPRQRRISLTYRNVILNNVKKS